MAKRKVDPVEEPVEEAPAEEQPVEEAPSEIEANGPRIILVESGRTDGRVALFERHPDHPGGEVYVAGERTVEVAETAAVLQAIGTGDLVRVTE